MLGEHRAIIGKLIEAHPDWGVCLGTGFVPIADFGAEGSIAAMPEGLTDKPLVIADIGHHSYWVNDAAMVVLRIDIWPNVWWRKHSMSDEHRIDVGG